MKKTFILVFLVLGFLLSACSNGQPEINLGIIAGLGGTMRLGSYPCDLKKGYNVYEVYKKQHIKERHRHRYEFNNEYLKQFEKAGMTASGINSKDNLVEIKERQCYNM